MKQNSETKCNVNPPGTLPGDSSGNLWNKAYISIMLINFLANVSFYMVATTLSVYTIELGASQALVGIIIGCFSVVSLVARPFSGAIVNRSRILSLMAVSLAGMGATSLGYGLLRIPGLFIFIRIAHGIFFSINTTATMVVVSKIIPKSRFTEGISYFGLSQVFATAVGPGISSSIGNAVGYQTSFFITTAVLLISSAAIRFLPVPPGTTKPATSASAAFHLRELLDTKLLRLVIFSALFSAFNGLNSSYILLIGKERSISSIALFFTVNSVSVIFVRLLFGKLSDRVTNVSYIIVPAMFSAIFGTIMIGISHTLIFFLLAAVIQAFGQGMVQPSVQAECLKRADPARLGTASSTFYMSSDVGQGLGVMIGGFLSGLWGYPSMYYVLAGCFAFGIPLYLVLNKNSPAVHDAAHSFSD